MRRRKKFLGAEIEPGWHFYLMDKLLDRGLIGVLAWAVLFLPTGLCILPMTILAWVLNPPWMEYDEAS